MSTLNKNNKFIPLLIWLFAFFILVFFTTNIYSNMQINLDENKTKKEELEKLDTKLTSLNNIQKELENKDNKESQKINKFTSDFSEDKIIKYINDYFEQINQTEWNTVLKLNSISFSDKEKSELWFKQINIDLKMSVNNKYTLNNLLDYLVSDINKYSFFITDFNFPIEKSWPYKINIPLKMFVR